MNSKLPSGTVTFLFTDIESSTRLWQENPQAMSVSHARHDAIVREAIEANNGYIFQIVGDSFSAAFHNAMDGLHAALAAQRGLTRVNDEGGRMKENPGKENSSFITHPSSLSLKVRMGLHTGTAEILPDGKYEGYATIASTQRVMSAAHGGQTLLTQTTHDLLQNALPDDVTLRDMGEHRLKDLRAPLRLYQVNAHDLPENFPTIKSLDTQPNNLPVQLTSFVGREKEIAEIKASFSASRLVTLTGSGGTGKTRLSIEVGTEELTHFSNGVWLIELAPLSDPAQIIPALAQAFGLQELPFNPLANLVTDYLRDKKLLLILDNCEHLIAACARLADDLLHQCAGLKILASSREALGIAGEVAYRTPSLADSESARLFVERARAANPKFSLTDSNAASVAKICSRLDGIPLAIELAAARTKLLSADQIAARLDDLFRLLVGGSRTALPRQQTLRAMIDWSYDLLSEEERGLLRIASVFVGGWTLDALEDVSDDSNAIEHLEGLINKSLVVTEEHGSEMRYFLLETIRQYAREKLFEAKQSSTARDRHLLYFEELSEEAWSEFRQGSNLFMRDKAVDELDNLRAALEWGLAHDAEVALHLAGNFCMILDWLGKQTEGRALLRSAIERVNALPAAEGDAQINRQKLIARAFLAEGTAAFRQGDSKQAALALQKVIEISRLTGDKIVLGYSLVEYAAIAQNATLPGAPEAVEEGLAIMTEAGDRWGIFMANLYKAWVAMVRGNFEETQTQLKKTGELLKEMPASSEAAAYFYVFMGMYERLRGNYQAARLHYEKALKVYQDFGQKYEENVTRSDLGHTARRSGELSQAKAIYHQTLLYWQDLGSRAAIANQFECFAFIAVAEEDPQRAAKLLGAAEAWRDKIQAAMTDQERVEYDQSMAQLRAMPAETEFNVLWAEGRAMTMEQAIQFALDS